MVQKDKDPETEILHKWLYRILIERSRTSGLTDPRRSGRKDPEIEILRKCSSRMIQVVHKKS